MFQTDLSRNIELTGNIFSIFVYICIGFLIEKCIFLQNQLTFE